MQLRARALALARAPIPSRASTASCSERSDCTTSSARAPECSRARSLFSARLRFLLRQGGELLVRALRGERFALDGQAIGLRHEAAQLVLELLDARALHLGGLVRGAECAIEVFPALLPGLQRLLGRLERVGGGRLRELRESRAAARSLRSRRAGRRAARSSRSMCRASSFSVPRACARSVFWRSRSSRVCWMVCSVREISAPTS